MKQSGMGLKVTERMMDSKAGVLQTLTVPTEFIAKVFDGTNVLLLFLS